MIVCDLDRCGTIALLPDREPATAHAWLGGQPQIEVVVRDRSGGCALAAAKAVSDAVQVADLWRLIENASHAFLDAVRKSMKKIRHAIRAATINRKLLACAEKLQYEGNLRREETNAVILDLGEVGMSIREIVGRTGHSRRLVCSIVRGQRTEVFRARRNSLEADLPWVDE